MARDPKTQAEQFTRGMRMVEQLRHFAGPPAQFWPSLLEATGLLSGAELALLLRKSGEDGKGCNGWASGRLNLPTVQPLKVSFACPLNLRMRRTKIKQL